MTDREVLQEDLTFCERRRTADAKKTHGRMTYPCNREQVEE